MKRKSLFCRIAPIACAVLVAISPKSCLAGADSIDVILLPVNSASSVFDYGTFCCLISLAIDPKPALWITECEEVSPLSLITAARSQASVTSDTVNQSTQPFTSISGWESPALAKNLNCKWVDPSRDQFRLGAIGPYISLTLSENPVNTKPSKTTPVTDHTPDGVSSDRDSRPNAVRSLRSPAEESPIYGCCRYAYGGSAIHKQEVLFHDHRTSESPGSVSHKQSEQQRRDCGFLLFDFFIGETVKNLP